MAKRTLTEVAQEFTKRTIEVECHCPKCGHEYTDFLFRTKLEAAAPDLLEKGGHAVEMLYAQYMEYALADPNRREDTIDLMMQVVKEWREVVAKTKGGD